MAESTRSPALPSTADPQPYIPLSWPAVAAFGAAVVFLMVLLGLAIDAYWMRRPLLEPELVLVFVVTTLLLSFVSRRIIRNSEGTRTGDVAVGGATLNLPVAAWWTAVVLGLAYFAYWFAVEYSVRREARAEVQKWIEAISRNEIPVAFHQTIAPTRRAAIAPADAARMENEFRESFIAFRQARLTRTIQRNPGGCRFEPGGLRNWAFDREGLSCTYAGVLQCPEGRFHVVVPLRGTEPAAADPEQIAAGRQWQILYSEDGYIDSSVLTPYGWAVNSLIAQGESHGRAFLTEQASGPQAQAVAVATFVSGEDADADFAPLAAVGGWGLRYHFPAAWLDRTADRLFTLEGGAAPSEGQRDRFRRMWRTTGVLPPGLRIMDSPDRGESLTITPVGLELKLPVELPMPTESFEPSAARGRLVLTCTSPDVVARLNALRSAADPHRMTERAPSDLNLPPAPWQVLRIESNLRVAPPSRPRPSR